jgi:hypothetical protein
MFKWLKDKINTGSEAEYKNGLIRNGNFFPGGNFLVSNKKTNGFFDISYTGSEKYSCKFKGKSYQCD